MLVAILNKAKHTKIWKSIGCNCSSCLQFLHDEFGFSKPKKRKFRDEAFYFASNEKMEFSATLCDGELTPPRFRVKQKGEFSPIELSMLHYGASLELLRSSGYEKMEDYFDEIENVIRIHLAQTTANNA